MCGSLIEGTFNADRVASISEKLSTLIQEAKDLRNKLTVLSKQKTSYNNYTKIVEDNLRTLSSLNTDVASKDIIDVSTYDARITELLDEVGEYEA